MKRPAHMTLVDADKFSALVSRCTEYRERAEKAEARIEALENVVAAKQNIIKSIQATVNDHLEAEAALRSEEET